MLKPLVKGLMITLREMFQRPITIQFPDEVREDNYAHWRGVHHLERDENGELKCVACLLCATVCPSKAITVIPGERKDHMKYPKEFRINLLRCIFCGYCVEACPRGAITMKTEFQLADYKKEDLIYDKERLLETTDFVSPRAGR